MATAFKVVAIFFCRQAFVLFSSSLSLTFTAYLYAIFISALIVDNKTNSSQKYFMRDRTILYVLFFVYNTLFVIFTVYILLYAGTYLNGIVIPDNLRWKDGVIIKS